METAKLIKIYHSTNDKAVLEWVQAELDKRLNKIDGHAKARIIAIKRRQCEEDTLILEVA